VSGGGGGLVSGGGAFGFVTTAGFGGPDADVVATDFA
jgi:hypothetical protein